MLYLYIMVLKVANFSLVKSLYGAFSVALNNYIIDAIQNSLRTGFQSCSWCYLLNKSVFVIFKSSKFY